jgi:hypothetical protein
MTVEVVAFLRDYLETDAELAVAALGEPDDDTYLAVEARAKSQYVQGPSPLGPSETRWATPGGQSPAATIDVSDSVRAGALYAVASAGSDAWLALVGDKRDPSGAALGGAVLVRRTPDGLRVAGRASLDPFSASITWEQSGGETVDLDTAEGAEIVQAPTIPAHAEFVERWRRR